MFASHSDEDDLDDLDIGDVAANTGYSEEDNVEEQRIVPACLTKDYVGAFIAAKKSSVATVTEAPTSAVRSAVSRG